MADPKVTIKIGAKTSAELKRVLDGEARELGQHNQKVKRSVRARAREQEKIEKDLAKTTKRVREADAKDFERGEKRKQRAARMTARETERGAKSAARAAATARRQAGSGVRNIGGGMGLGGMAAGMAGMVGGIQVINAAGAESAAVGQGVSAVTGIETIADSIRSAASFETTLRQTVNEVYEPGSRDAADAMERGRSQIFETSATTGIAPELLLAGLRQQQVKFSQFELGLDTLDATARAAVGTGEDFGQLVDVSGSASQAFGLSAEDTRTFLGLLRETGTQGSLTPGVIAEVFSRSFAEFTATTGRSGLEGAQEFLALAQISARTAPGNPEIVNTQMRAFVAALANPDVQARLATQGVRVREFASPEEERGFRNARRGGHLGRAMSGAEFNEIGPSGEFRDTTDILNDLQAQNFSMEQLQLVLGDKRSLRGYTALDTFRAVEGKSSLETLRGEGIGAAGEAALAAAAADVIANDAGTQARIRGANVNIGGRGSAIERLGSDEGRYQTNVEAMQLNGGFLGGIASLVSVLPGMAALASNAAGFQNRVDDASKSVLGVSTKEAGFDIQNALLEFFGSDLRVGTQGGDPATVRLAQDTPLHVIVDTPDPRRETGTE